MSAFFFSPLFYFFFFPFSFPLPPRVLSTVAGSEQLGVQRERFFPRCREADTRASSVRPVHGRRWLWSHPWMEAGNRAALGKRLGRWFHLAAPFISLLELVEVLKCDLFPFLSSPHSKCLFFPPKSQTFSWCFLLGTNKNF